MTEVPTFSNQPLTTILSIGNICCLLGAGFSKATYYQLPVSRDVLSRDWRVRDPKNPADTIQFANAHPDLAILLDRIERRYGRLPDLDLEAVMTDLDARARGIAGLWEDADAATIAPDSGDRQDAYDSHRDYRELLDFVCLRLRTTYPEPHPCDVTEGLLGSLRPSDSVVTLNYDTIIERHWTDSTADVTCPDRRVALLHHAIGPSGSFWTGAATPMFRHVKPDNFGWLVKLHGSVDWRSCPNPGCPNHQYIESLLSDFHKKHDRPEVLHCVTCGTPPETVIIPPVTAKPFDRFSKLRLMWLQAYRALRFAQRWVFIGVSFATTDTLLRSLIRIASERAWLLGKEAIGDGFQICVVSRTQESAQASAQRLFECVSPIIQGVIRNRPNAVSLFGSVKDYIAAERIADRNRRDDLGA